MTAAEDAGGRARVLSLVQRKPKTTTTMALALSLFQDS
jgi:hypothetical protein